MKRLSFAFAALLWLPVVPLLAQSNKTHGEVKEVTLSRGMCFGSCPAYELTLRSDGTAIYTGARFVGKIGKYTGHFWEGDFKHLTAVADKLGFWSLKPHYAVTYTDQATQTLTFKTASGKTVVSEYGPSGPQELWALQTIVDGITANVTDWKKG